VTVPATAWEVAGVRLTDVFRDRNGELWEVVALCDQPQATFRRVRECEPEMRVSHVIGCRNMEEQFPEGPLRPVGRT
jgi:hypothetical protein